MGKIIIIKKRISWLAKLALLIPFYLAGSALIGQQADTGLCSLTIITHGYQLINDRNPVTGWVPEMTEAIQQKTGVNTPIYIARYFESAALGTIGDQFKIILYDTNSNSDRLVDSIDLNKTGGAIVIIDWTVVADEFKTINTQSVAEKFIRDILEPSHNGHHLYEVPIHLIGHSRGTSLNSKITHWLAQRGGDC